MWESGDRARPSGSNVAPRAKLGSIPQGVPPLFQPNSTAMPPDSRAEHKTAVASTVPTGTVTFLFSDIEGSTQRWESNRAAMDAAVKRHDALMRDVVERHNGFVFKTVGDAFCVAFQSAPD